MTNLPFEPSGKWSVKHGQDYMADIVNTRNMDFDAPGFASVGKKPVAIYTTTQSANFGTVVSIVPNSTTGASAKYYIITSSKVYSWDASTSTLTLLDSATPTMGLGSDGIMFNGKLLVTGTTTAKAYTDAGDSWGLAVISGLSSSYPHPLSVVEHMVGVPLVVGDGNIVHQYDTSFSEVTANKLQLPPQYIVTGLRWSGGNMYAATRNVTGGSAKLFIWNGTGTSAQLGWDVKADWIYSMVDYDASITVLTSSGQLLRYAGGGFTELAHFPVYDTPYSWNSQSALTNGIGRCANRGMVAHGDNLFINVDGALNASLTDMPSRFMVEQPSGLWCYDPGVGLYHKAGYKYTKYNEAAYTFASSNFVFSTAHNMQTGDPVYPTNTTGLTRVNANQLYYAIVVDSLTIQLANNQYDAQQGMAMTITGTAAAGTMIIDTFDSLSAAYTQSFPGAVCLFITANPPSMLGTDLMYAGTATTASNTLVSSLMSLGNGHHVASFTTTPVPSSGVTDSFTKLLQVIDTFGLHATQIIVKYRIGTNFGLPNAYRKDGTAMATWTSTSSFTIDSTKKDFSAAQVGNEIEIIEGSAAGYTAHITVIDKSTSTYTVTIDETLPVAVSDRSEIIVDNWIKKPAITYMSTGIEKLFAQIGNLSVVGTYVQFKVEMRGMNFGTRKLTTINSPSKEPA